MPFTPAPVQGSFTASMKAVIQRVSQARVEVDGSCVGSIDTGFVVLLGVEHTDTAEQARALATRVAGLRIFADENGRMNLDLAQVNGQVLAISQFTLCANEKKSGRRPSFTAAAPPEQAEPIYREFCEALRGHGLTVAEGVFGAMMDVSLVNQGPVTLIL